MVDYTVHYACTFHLSKHSSCKPIRNYRLCDFGKSLDMTKIHCKTHKPTGYSKSNFIFNNCKLFKKKEVFMTCITDQIRLCACHNKCFFLKENMKCGVMNYENLERKVELVILSVHQYLQK